MPDLETVMRGRRSVRNFSSQRPERQQINELIELAITAPSASNNQPWRFFVSDKPEVIASLAAAVELAVEQVKANLEPDSLPAFTAYGDYFVRFREAPVVIVPAYRPLAILSQMTPSTPLIERLEHTSGLASTSLAVQNLLLAAHDRGLAATCMTGPLLAAPQIETIMGIPSAWHMALLIAVGYAAEEPKVSSRKSLKTVTRWVEQSCE